MPQVLTCKTGLIFQSFLFILQRPYSSFIRADEGLLTRIGLIFLVSFLNSTPFSLLFDFPLQLRKGLLTVGTD